jgi:CheY-like chemotaxis protein
LDINQVVKQVAKLLRRTIPKMIHIDMDLADPIHTINADPGQLEQVLLNIGVNAKDAMPDGGRLTFKTENVEPDEAFRRVNLANDAGSYVSLSVIDTGAGMTDDILEHIFEPFFTTKKTGQGTGLGLAMAYGIIKNHCGHLSCHSAPLKGTTFQVYLPAIDAAAQEEMEAPPIPIVKGEGETILVIDDEAFLRDLAEDMLTTNGYQVITAVSGEEGLELYKQHHEYVKLIILDLIMPGMGGKQCLVEILNIDPKAKILISSGYALDEPENDNKLMQARGFIHKPYNFRQMLQTIRHVIYL